MKIIIFDGSFNTTTFINRLIKGLSINHEVFVFGFDENIQNKISGIKYIGLGTNNSRFFFLVRSFQLRGFSIRKLVDLCVGLVFRNKSMIRQQNIQFAIDSIQPDILHFQWVSVLSYFKDLQLPTHTKTILSQRGFHINVRPFVNIENKLFLEGVFKNIDGFHSVSKAIQEKSNEIYASPSKIDHVVYSGFDTDSFQTKTTWNITKQLQILSIGRDHWKKDYRTALLAMYLLKERKIPFHYTIVGVKNSEELLFLVNDLHLKDNITFLDSISQGKVYEKMLDSDLFLLPSVEEGIANVCIEAMLSKLPVLSTDCGGMSELIVDSETGFLVPTRNPIALADKISIFSKLQEIDILQLVNAAYIKATTQHTSKQMVDGMISLYNKVYENN
jgi:colanic acid/amylovoran biosynthesis glycosyltransferase